ncbi:uncharacterized protein LOC135223927 [Macrobrachium nipponense]|uniref:uncharacterized protein LOC135223927 n=1 Tax=Macrobrachium nipponense TaxID=159736 RepID=UPI0030C83F31
MMNEVSFSKDLKANRTVFLEGFLCSRSSWISWPLAFLLQGVFDDLADDPALPVRFRNWNTTLRLKGTSPSRIVEKVIERRSPQPSPSTSPIPDQQQQQQHPGPCCTAHAIVGHRSPVRQRCRAHTAANCGCESPVKPKTVSVSPSKRNGPTSQANGKC